MSFSTSTHDIYGTSSNDSNPMNNNTSKNEAIGFPRTAEKLEEEEEKKNIDETHKSSTKKKLENSSHSFDQFVLIGSENDLSAAEGFKNFTDSISALQEKQYAELLDLPLDYEQAVKGN